MYYEGRSPISHHINSHLGIQHLEVTEKDHLKSLKTIFPQSNKVEIKEIYTRMKDYAEACGIDANQMMANVVAGYEIAVKITNHKLEAAHPTKDIINLDWYLRCQMAKMNCLYMKGTVKFPDPDNKFLTFIVHSESTYHGTHHLDMVGRLSSHFPEKIDKINQNPLKLTDGTWLCFNDEQKAKLKKDGVNKSMIINIDNPAIGIDASGPSYRPGMGLAGEKNATFLIMSFPETNDDGEVQTIAMKAEGYSAVSPMELHHGEFAERVKDSALHTKQYLKTKGPLQKKVRTKKIYKDRKEDKLKENIKTPLKEITILQGKKDGSKGEKAIYASYKELMHDTDLGNDYSLPHLKHHLELMLPILADKSAELTNENEFGHPELDNLKKQRSIIQNILKEIVRLDNEALFLSKDWKYHLHPRSQEVILPTLEEMIQDKVPFVPK